MNAILQRRRHGDIYLIAILASMLLSCWMGLRETVINPDAICYLLSAEAVGQSGIKAAMQLCGQAKWPFYSILIYGFSHLSHLSYLTAAYAIDGLFTLLTVTFFLAICQELGATRRILWWAALVILLAHDFNSTRQYIVRDHGFWASYLASLFFMLRYFRQPNFLSASCFSFSLFIAALFRIEGAIFLFALPFVAFLQQGKWYDRCKHFFVLSLPVMLVVALGMIWLAMHPQGGVEKFGRVAEITNQVQHGFELIVNRFQLSKTGLTQHVLNGSSARDAGMVLLLTFVCLYLINIVSSLSLIYAFLVVYAWIKKSAPLTRSALIVLLAYLCVNLFVSLGFFAENLFLSKRYLIAFSLILMLWVPFALDAIFIQSKRLFAFVLLLIVIAAAGGIIDFGYSKQYVRDAGVWLADNVKTNSRLYANDIQLMYYANHFGMTIFQQENALRNVNVIADGRWKQYDYVALRFNPNDTTDDVALVVAEIKSVPEKEFVNKRGDRVNIYKIKHGECMNITVIGAGYVGLVTGACFAELGNHVTCVDVNVDKINNLKNGILPIYEPGLEPMVMSNMQEGRLHFATSLAELTIEPNVIFIAVGTPSDADGSADIKYVLAAAENIGAHITQDCVIVDKSTVPVGMGDKVSDVIQNELSKRGVQVNFDVVSNPEFLREGAAIEDFMKPDRVIIGLASNNAKSVMLDLYLPILRSPERIYFMNVKDAEMTKYAANAMLATRISFMNEMAVLCERMGVDIKNVRIGIGSDARIGSAFLQAGCGYGGSCFPKDVRALMKMAEIHQVDPVILNAVEGRNFKQKYVMPEKVVSVFGEDLSGVTIGVWGLAFKPGTDDMREASSLVLIEQLIKRGAKVQAYDPEAMPVAREMMPKDWLTSGKVTLTEHQYDALKEVDALALVTEWKPFCYPDMAALKTLMRKHIIFDGRNQYDPAHIRAAGFDYYGIGR